MAFLVGKQTLYPSARISFYQFPTIELSFSPLLEVPKGKSTNQFVQSVMRQTTTTTTIITNVNY